MWPYMNLENSCLQQCNRAATRYSLGSPLFLYVQQTQNDFSYELELDERIIQLDSSSDCTL